MYLLHAEKYEVLQLFLKGKGVEGEDEQQRTPENRQALFIDIIRGTGEGI